MDNNKICMAVQGSAFQVSGSMIALIMLLRGSSGTENNEPRTANLNHEHEP
jgi:hypothetical protein